ncbi:MAG: hypothetical protein IKT32_03930, partial [Clostridia bacterium]|nr:hypothetical protein [Clostridia bacterium]
MQYHISTGLIVKHFEENCGCPLCTIEKIVETNICRELLADGCMDDDVRKEVNEKGFCQKHFEQLFEMPSKLQYELSGKAMIVAYSRPIAMKIYAKLLE